MKASLHGENVGSKFQRIGVQTQGLFLMQVSNRLYLSQGEAQSQIYKFVLTRVNFFNPIRLWMLQLKGYSS